MADFPKGPHVDLKTGFFTLGTIAYLQNQQNTNTTNNVNSGAAVRAAQDAADAQAAALLAQINAQAQAIQSVSTGSTIFDSDTFDGVLVSGASWTVLATNTVTPTGAGNYTISGTIDGTFADLSPGPTWRGQWRLVEELSGGGSANTLASGGANSAIFSPPSETEGITIPGIMTLSGSFPYLNTVYASTLAAPVDIRLEIQRTTGSSDIIGGLSGILSTAWA